MPELPEVETVKNELSPHVIGRRITGLTLFWEGMVKEPAVKEFCERTVGQEITGITRRGKYLILALSSGEAFIIHLKMSGSLFIGQDSSEPPRFTRAVICLDKGTKIFFRDPRKFGVMRVVKDSNSVVGKLGPEALGNAFTPQLLAQQLANRAAPIKALLCDQNLIAGVGNMYADEALFVAKIHPLRTGASLSPQETNRLHSAIQQVLRAGISNKGASTDTYFRPDGTRGTAHLEFKVAHGRGKSCPVCGTLIERITVRNRGTYFCPKCQPSPNV
ncbi:MAG: bifunctional DNA-formamidopyrimidine glycosylase/DNA-(apurinic or apyrimidinic site) lyase [Chloroflexi bacterium]|nr:bifunctional DNA-formamidopyrimidine glycosylase/DNA-(apurinic or apyrimidinic site) lyase [Chloroflexota bacterium]